MKPMDLSDAKIPFDSLAEHIRQLSAGRQLVYIPNPGNWGDGLIRWGTKAFLADYGLKHIEINIAYRKGLVALLPLLLQSGKYFFLHGGGGAWCRVHNRAVKTVGFISRFTSAYIVLPSTYEIAPRRRNGLFYRRDNAESLQLMPESRFCHDMAFYLAHRKVPYSAVKDGSSANMFRTDGESSRDQSGLPSDNVDLSTQGDHMSECDSFLATLASVSAVHTDRLHISIGAALVGARVHLHTGNYFKIRAIYEASMNTYFASQIEFAGASTSSITVPHTL